VRLHATGLADGYGHSVGGTIELGPRDEGDDGRGRVGLCRNWLTGGNSRACWHIAEIDEEAKSPSRFEPV